MKAITNFLKNGTALALMAVAVLIPVVQEAKADALTVNRVEQAERIRLTKTISVSATTYNTTSYIIPSPYKGYLNELTCGVEGNAALNGPVTITPKIAGVSLTLPAITIPSGSVPGYVTTSIFQVNPNLVISNSQLIAKSGSLELKPVATATNGAGVTCVVTLVPNYKLP